MRAHGVGPDRADDGEEVGAGFDKRAAILLRDAADRAARHDRRLASVAEQLGVGVVPGGLSCARVRRRDRAVVRDEHESRSWALGIGRLGSIFAPLLGGWLLSLGMAPTRTSLRACLYAVIAGIETALLTVHGSRVERLAVVKVMS